MHAAKSIFFATQLTCLSAVPYWVEPILTCCRTNIWAHFVDDCDNFSLQLRGISNDIIERRKKKKKAMVSRIK